MTSGSRASGHYSQNGLAASLSGGYRIAVTDNAWIAPVVDVSGSSASGTQYSLSNGMMADVKSVRSLTTEAGMEAGYRFASVTSWVKATVGREHVSNNQVLVNSDLFTSDASGAFGTVQGGISGDISEKVRLSVDVKYRKGSHTESPVTANLGLSFAF